MPPRYAGAPAFETYAQWKSITLLGETLFSA
jgi:hypothetical protein